MSIICLGIDAVRMGIDQIKIEPRRHGGTEALLEYCAILADETRFVGGLSIDLREIYYLSASGGHTAPPWVRGSVVLFEFELPG